DLNNGCTSFDSIAINLDTIPPDIMVDDYYLNCDSSFIKMRARSSFPNIDYYWNGPDTIFVQGDVCYTNTPGTYIVFAEGENRCVTSDTIMVYDIPVMPEFEAYADNINCIKDSAQLLAIGVEDDYGFEWTGPNGFYSKEKSPVVSMQGDYFLHVVGQNKCDSVAQVSVSVDTIKPQISIYYEDSIICEKQNGILTTEILNKNDSVYIFNWDTKDGKILNGSHSGVLYFKGEGMYAVDVVSVKNGCAARDSFLVKEAEYSLDSAFIKVIAPTCFGYNDGGFVIDSVIGGVRPYTFSIDNYWFSNSNEFNSKSSGVYDIFVKDANGCRLDTMIIIPNGADVQLRLISDKTTIFPGETVNLKGLVLSDNAIDKIIWNPEDYFPFMDTLDQQISPDESIDISLKVFDINNCWDEDNLRIYVKNNPEIYIPDIFTPDYDNINDYFFVKAGKGIKSIKKFMIFDRWGEKVFEKNDMRLNVPIEGWDGKFKNKEAMEGVYVYYIEVELENGKIIKYSGDITLIR
ncbi:MAG TPA: gliding motility-associated C-terminal domain-containing protein, partial [Bacteroidetes bacterium]|nr:gliding motility-associated C-terminal domain-containing protein [Bacteroidota bacterium]